MIDSDFEAGEVILIDKPYTWTSFDVVKKLRNAIRIKKIGHAGTLDPLATGLLILCTGKKTKQIDSFMAKEKEYTGTMVIGKTTPSIDLETEVDSETDISHVTEEQIYAAVQPFQGVIDQVPPSYSAIKIDGERVYKRARAGEVVEMKSRQVEINEFSISKIEFPVIHFKVVCSKGTYIRSLIRDFGINLKVGAYMSSLRRTRIGAFKVEDAYSIDVFLSTLKEKE